jgi:hypothetical protein
MKNAEQRVSSSDPFVRAIKSKLKSTSISKGKGGRSRKKEWRGEKAHPDQRVHANASTPRSINYVVTSEYG